MGALVLALFHRMEKWRRNSAVVMTAHSSGENESTSLIGNRMAETASLIGNRTEETASQTGETGSLIGSQMGETATSHIETTPGQASGHSEGGNERRESSISGINSYQQVNGTRNVCVSIL